jgi:chaperone modulatory protein CbpM
MKRGSEAIQGVVLDEALIVDLEELTRLCGISSELLVWMVGEGLLQPTGRAPREWRFSGLQIRRARRALRLRRDLELDWSGIALALDLLDELEDLRARIRCLELQLGRGLE